LSKALSVMRKLEYADVRMSVKFQLIVQKYFIHYENNLQLIKPQVFQLPQQVAQCLPPT
jgi:hypothetical protein